MKLGARLLLIFCIGIIVNIFCLETEATIYEQKESENAIDVISTTEKMISTTEVQITTTIIIPTTELTTEEITTENSKWINLSESDYQYLCRMVETEVFQGTFEGKCNVASVAINRYYNGKFGNTITEIITSPNQFAYGRTKISKETKEAVNFVIDNGDTSNGSLFFHSFSKTSTFNGANYVFTDSVGHNFYK